MDQESKTTVSQWDCGEVYEWAAQKVGDKIAALLRQEEVDGSALLGQTEASLRAYGIAGGPATKLYLSLKALQSSQQQVQDMQLDPEYRMKLDTHEQLHMVWDVIGTSAEDRDLFLSDLARQVQALYLNRLQEQRDTRDSCEEKIRGLQMAIGNLCDQLQIEAPEPVAAVLPLLQQMTCLATQLDVIKQERERQQQRNGKALSELAQLYDTLGEPLPDTQHLQLGAQRLAEIHDMIAQVRQKIADKTVLLETAKAKIYAELQDLMFEEDEYTQLDRLVLLGGADIPLSALGELACRGVQLEELNLERKNKLKALARKIATIWNILNIPAEHRKEFMGGNAGLGRATFEKCERELAELEAQKRAQLPQLLEASEEKLKGLWAEACTSETEQNNFYESYREMNDELKFNAIRQQLSDVEKRLEDMQPLLALVEKREQIKQDVETYASLQSDPNRFKIAGLPLRLEQMRKNFQSFPKLAASMRLEIEAWEAVNGPFLRNGERLLTTMEAQGEFEEGYFPGALEPRRVPPKSELPVNTPRKPVRSTTIPRPTPGKREESKHSTHSLPTPSKTQQLLQSARKKVPPTSARKNERENENSNHKSDLPSKQREKPAHEQTTPKRTRTPLKESNHA